jgi:hypothetical protein
MITQSTHPCEIRRILADEGEKAVTMRTFVTDAMLAPGRLPSCGANSPRKE